MNDNGRLDFMTNEDKHLIAAAAGDVPMNVLCETLLEELIAITVCYVGRANSGLYNARGHHHAVRQIGEQLRATGGLRLMQAVAYRLHYRGHEAHFDGLAYAWNGIGDWQA